VSGVSAGSRINPLDTPVLEIFGIFGQVETPDRTEANLPGFLFRQKVDEFSARDRSSLVDKPLVHPRKRQRTLAFGGVGTKSAKDGHKIWA